MLIYSDRPPVHTAITARREAGREWRHTLATIQDAYAHLVDAQTQAGDYDARSKPYALEVAEMDFNAAVAAEVAAQARYRAAAAEEDRVRGEMMAKREEAARG